LEKEERFMEDNKVILTVESIRNCVYMIRGQQVMLDSDLADIYGYEVKRLNEQVKRNINRFPEDFMFQLTREEVDLVKSQNATSRNDSFFEGQDGGRRKMPYAFTEQGIYKGQKFEADVAYIDIYQQAAKLLESLFYLLQKLFSNTSKGRIFIPYEI
jgi:hypothetical protein